MADINTAPISPAAPGSSPGPQARVPQASGSVVGGTGVPDSREQATTLAQPRTRPPADIGEIKNLQFFTTMSNMVKSFGSGAFKVAGWSGATLAAAFYFFLNLKSVSMVLAVPTLAAFYVAHNLKQGIKKQGLDITHNPVSVLERARKDSNFFVSDLSKVLYAASQINEMKPSNPKRQEAEVHLNFILGKAKEELAQHQGSPERASLDMVNRLEQLITTIEDLN